ncbi:MAG: hypothetical protein J5485_01465 [Candidatus Methanomethylophilaceae archaeon]|nr:hypothetical protein [Candidatus Methanomethylophilaceae archaeon]
MADRYCPYCGEMVTSTSITCPKCYKKLPNQPEPSGGEGGSGGKTSASGVKSRSIALLLAIIPGIFGVLGLGLLYYNKSSKPGIMLLAIGLLTFILFMVITTSSIPILNIILAIPVAVFYGILYIGNLVGTLLGSPSS